MSYLVEIKVEGLELKAEDDYLKISVFEFIKTARLWRRFRHVSTRRFVLHGRVMTSYFSAQRREANRSTPITNSFTTPKPTLWVLKRMNNAIVFARFL